MSTDLYEILEIQADATPEQIRRAYKKRALQTHPDRVSPTEKAQAEERFRQVNNAYEVLTDPQKRESYDRHGVWPPPAEDPHTRSQDSTGVHPFYPGGVFTFTDPFELFESLFGHTNTFHEPFPFTHPPIFHDPFFAPATFAFPAVGSFSPFGPGIRMGGGLLPDIFPHDPFMPLMMGETRFRSQGVGNRERATSHFSSTSSHPTNRGAGGSQWVSESRSTSTVNGLTTRIHERVDFLGNVHTTTTHPGGNKTFTINGVPQNSGRIDAAQSRHALHPNPMGYPRGSRRHHHHRRNDHSQGGRERHDTYDYIPDHRGPWHPRD